MPESATTKIVRLETQMNSVEEKVDKLDRKLDDLIVKIDAVNTINSELLILKSNYLGVQTKLEKIERQKWISPTITGVTVSVLTALITFFALEYFK